MDTSRLCLALSLAFLPVASATVPIQQPPTTAAGATEELIAEKDPRSPADDKEDVTSGDGRRVAWRTPVEKKWVVMLNGVPQGGPYDEVRDLYFSPDGDNLVYFGRKDKRWTLVANGRESSEWFDDVRGPVFNPKTSQVAYAGRRDKRWRFVDNGTSAPTTYSDIRLPSYSDDGRRVAYRAKPRKQWVLVVDGVPQSLEFDAIIAHRFSPDGTRIAYVGERSDKLIVVADGREGPPFDIVGGPQFSPDSRRFGYAGAQVHRGFGSERATGRTVIDDVPTAEFEGAKVGSLLKNALTMSTPHLLRGYFLQLHAQTHGVTGPVFSPDSARVAYATRTGDDAASVQVDGKPGATYASVLGGPVFSADGRHVAIVAADAEGKVLVVDDKIVGRFPAGDSGLVEGLQFAPDNERVISRSVKGGQMFERGETSRARRRLYVNTEAGPEFNAHFLGAVEFTPDGAHLLYIVAGVEGQGDASYVVADGIAGKAYDAVFGRIRIDPDGGAINFTARSGRKFYLVRQRLGQTTTE